MPSPVFRRTQVADARSGGIEAASFFSNAGHEVTAAVPPSFLITTLGAFRPGVGGD